MLSTASRGPLGGTMRAAHLPPSTAVPIQHRATHAHECLFGYILPTNCTRCGLIIGQLVSEVGVDQLGKSNSWCNSSYTMLTYARATHPLPQPPKRFGRSATSSAGHSDKIESRLRVSPDLFVLGVAVTVGESFVPCQTCDPHGILHEDV